MSNTLIQIIVNVKRWTESSWQSSLG